MTTLSLSQSNTDECLPHSEPRRELRRLELGAHPLAHFPSPVDGVETQHPDRSSVGSPKAEEALKGRGLAGAVGSDQAEHLAGLHREGDLGYGDGWAIALVQTGNLDNRVWRREHGQTIDGVAFCPQPPGGQMAIHRSADAELADRAMRRRRARGDAWP